MGDRRKNRTGIIGYMFGILSFDMFNKMFRVHFLSLIFSSNISSSIFVVQLLLFFIRESILIVMLPYIVHVCERVQVVKNLMFQVRILRQQWINYYSL